jgi:hypothetical protein
MTDRPDWGWGANPPVFTFTEHEIRAVAEAHHYSPPDQGERGGLCSCRYSSSRPAVEYTIDHFIEKLKEARERALAAKPVTS